MGTSVGSLKTILAVGVIFIHALLASPNPVMPFGKNWLKFSLRTGKPPAYCFQAAFGLCQHEGSLKPW